MQGFKLIQVSKRGHWTKWLTFYRFHFKCEFKIKITLQVDSNSIAFVPKLVIDNKSVLDQVMAWCQMGHYLYIVDYAP